MDDSRRLAPPPRWTVVTPVKGGPTAKSRLGAAPEVALAIALDSVDAALGCPDVDAVLAVTADDAAAAGCAALGAHVVAESRPGAGLNAAIVDGVAAALRLRGAGAPIAVLLADVPALTGADLAAALRGASDVAGEGAAGGCVVVPDADGSGTVLLAAPDGRLVAPAFGRGSAWAHERAGARRWEPDLPRLRRDVDSPADLTDALALGVGARTAEAVTRSAAASA